jgi:transcriptional regulator with XRE-family HTH domain
MQAADFNHLNVWLKKKLDERGLSVEDLARAANLARRNIYKWMSDERRPTYDTAPRVVAALSKIPVLKRDERGNITQVIEEVTLAEFYRQYTPRPLGRPRGSGRN